MVELNSLNRADIGDFEKLMAVTTVMTQSVITFLLPTTHAIGQQFFLGGIYELIKFSAPAFIFGIVYSTVRTHPDAHLRDYPHFMLNRWHLLFVPSILWTTVYLLVLPQLQQHQHYHNWASFAWQFINGNAAPHLWYNVMMLQFIIIMPLFWWLARLVRHRPARGCLLFSLALLFEIRWHLLYERVVFHGYQAQHWYLLDRVFPSFIIFAVGGVLTHVFATKLRPFMARHWLAQLVLWLFFLYIVTADFFRYGYPVRLTNAPYYLPSMIFYNLSTIGLIATLLGHLQKFRNQWLPFIHWFALYAHRAFLGHIFWLYWLWQASRRFLPWLPLELTLPLLVILTVICSFAFAYGAHRTWSGIKRACGHRQIKNG